MSGVWVVCCARLRATITTCADLATAFATPLSAPSCGVPTWVCSTNVEALWWMSLKSGF